ncbi:MAG TPA: SgcJ/EcaC family oxidoreductase [Myxococcales bacterium]|jgi:uncharacterized protein (TIGR02246 family)
MADHELVRLIAAADAAINREDFDAVLEFYAEDATLVVMPGRTVTGKPAIRKALEAIAEHFEHSLQVSEGEMVVVEGGETALVLAATKVGASMKADPAFVQERRATYVFRRQQGKWLCVVDNSYGTDLLERRPTP